MGRALRRAELPGALETSRVPQQLGVRDAGGPWKITQRTDHLTVEVFLLRRPGGLEFPESISTSASWGQEAH